MGRRWGSKTNQDDDDLGVCPLAELGRPTLVNPKRHAPAGVCQVCFELKPLPRVCLACEPKDGLCQDCLRQYFTQLVQDALYAMPMVHCALCRGRVETAAWTPFVCPDTRARYLRNASALLSLRCPVCDETTSFFASVPHSGPHASNCDGELAAGRRRAAALASALQREQVWCDLLEERAAFRRRGTAIRNARPTASLSSCGPDPTSSCSSVHDSDRHAREAAEGLVNIWRRFQTGHAPADEFIAKLHVAWPPGRTTQPPAGLRSVMRSRLPLCAEDAERRLTLQLAWLRRYPKVRTPCCKSRVCFKCKVRGWHRGQTCEERQRRETGRVAQNCPNCQVPTTRSEGCTHMRCICGAEWTWKSPTLDGENGEDDEDIEDEGDSDASSSGDSRASLNLTGRTALELAALCRGCPRGDGSIAARVLAALADAPLPASSVARRRRGGGHAQLPRRPHGEMLRTAAAGGGDGGNTENSPEHDSDDDDEEDEEQAQMEEQAPQYGGVFASALRYIVNQPNGNQFTAELRMNVEPRLQGVPRSAASGAETSVPGAQPSEASGAGAPVPDASATSSATSAFSPEPRQRARTAARNLPLNLAVRARNPAAVRVLLERGAVPTELTLWELSRASNDADRRALEDALVPKFAAMPTSALPLWARIQFDLSTQSSSSSSSSSAAVPAQEGMHAPDCPPAAADLKLDFGVSTVALTALRRQRNPELKKQYEEELRAHLGDECFEILRAEAATSELISELRSLGHVGAKPPNPELIEELLGLGADPMARDTIGSNGEGASGEGSSDSEFYGGGGRPGTFNHRLPNVTPAPGDDDDDGIDAADDAFHASVSSYWCPEPSERRLSIAELAAIHGGTGVRSGASPNCGGNASGLSALMKERPNLARQLLGLKAERVPQTSPLAAAWTCPRCTLRNDAFSYVCDACERPRPFAIETIVVEGSVPMGEDAGTFDRGGSSGSNSRAPGMGGAQRDSRAEARRRASRRRKGRLLVLALRHCNTTAVEEILADWDAEAFELKRHEMAIDLNHMGFTVTQSGSCLVIQSIDPASAAARAGIYVGMQVVSIAGEVVSTEDEFEGYVKSLQDAGAASALMMFSPPGRPLHGGPLPGAAWRALHSVNCAAERCKLEEILCRFIARRGLAATEVPLWALVQLSRMPAFVDSVPSDAEDTITADAAVIAAAEATAKVVAAVAADDHEKAGRAMGYVMHLTSISELSALLAVDSDSAHVEKDVGSPRHPATDSQASSEASDELANDIVPNRDNEDTGVADMPANTVEPAEPAEPAEDATSDPWLENFERRQADSCFRMLPLRVFIALRRCQDASARGRVEDWLRGHLGEERFRRRYARAATCELLAELRAALSSRRAPNAALCMELLTLGANIRSREGAQSHVGDGGSDDGSTAWNGDFEEDPWVNRVIEDDGSLRTPLELLVLNRHTQPAVVVPAVAKAVEFKVDPNRGRYGEKPLTLAIRARLVAAAKALLDNGASITRQALESLRRISDAQARQEFEDVLMEHWAGDKDANDRGGLTLQEVGLWAAVQCGFSTVACKAIEEGEVVDPGVLVALRRCRRTASVDLAREAVTKALKTRLGERGFETLQAEAANGELVGELMEAVREGRDPDEELVYELIRLGADPQVRAADVDVSDGGSEYSDEDDDEEDDEEAGE